MMNDQTLLIVGATSGIARAMARQAAAEGARLHLAARDTTALERIVRDLRVRYRATVTCSRFDAFAYETHATLVRAAAEAMGRLDGVVVAFGHLGDQETAEQNFEVAHSVINANYTGAVSLLTHAANHLEAQGHGFIVGVASVAGDRGRQSNYIYGSAKGAFALYLQGLRSRLAKKGVHVMTVKPGFVDTQMTFGLPGLFLVASPARVAADVWKGVRKQRDVLYTPSFWRYIMRIIRAVPEPIFKKLSL